MSRRPFGSGEMAREDGDWAGMQRWRELRARCGQQEVILHSTAVKSSEAGFPGFHIWIASAFPAKLAVVLSVNPHFEVWGIEESRG